MQEQGESREAGGLGKNQRPVEIRTMGVKPTMRFPAVGGGFTHGVVGIFRLVGGFGICEERSR